MTAFLISRFCGPCIDLQNIETRQSFNKIFSSFKQDYHPTTTPIMSSVAKCKAVLLAAQEAHKEVEQQEAEMAWELAELEAMEHQKEEHRGWRKRRSGGR